MVTLLSFLLHVGVAQLNESLKDKAIRQLEREAASEQMLLPYKLGEDYARPAVPYKCLVFIPHHDPLCLSYGPASGQFGPQLSYIYSNQALAGDLFMCMLRSQSRPPPEVLAHSLAENEPRKPFVSQLDILHSPGVSTLLSLGLGGE